MRFHAGMMRDSFLQPCLFICLWLLLLLDGVQSFVPSRQTSSAGRQLVSQPTVLYASDVLKVLGSATVVNPETGRPCEALEGLGLRAGGNNSNSNSNNNPFAFLGKAMKPSEQKSLVILMPQLGDFDSAEYAELLAAVKPDLDDANLSLRIIGIGDCNSAQRFAKFAGLPLSTIRVDPKGQLHRDLSLHGGPDWDIPSFLPDSLLQWFADYVVTPWKTPKRVGHWWPGPG